MSYAYQIKSLEQYQSEYKKSVEDPEKFWGDIAANFYWRKKWESVLNWNFTEPKIEWFSMAKNVVEYANENGIYDELAEYMRDEIEGKKSKKMGFL